jgi:hypothetical protein
MIRWEHKEIIDITADQLGQIGQLGWELVSVISYNDVVLNVHGNGVNVVRWAYYFKRQIADESEIESGK